MHCLRPLSFFGSPGSTNRPPASSHQCIPGRPVARDTAEKNDLRPLIFFGSPGSTDTTHQPPVHNHIIVSSLLLHPRRPAVRDTAENDLRPLIFFGSPESIHHPPASSQQCIHNNHIFIFGGQRRRRADGRPTETPDFAAA